MNTFEDSDVPSPASEWWKNVVLEDLINGAKAVKAFLREDSTADSSQVLKSLRLLILCEDDHAWLADTIKERTANILGAAKNMADSNYLDAIRHLTNWQSRLGVIEEGLSLLPIIYKQDIAEETQSVEECKQHCMSDRSYYRQQHLRKNKANPPFKPQK
jgi:hypothetical protein